MSADDDHTHPEGFVSAVVDAIESDIEAIWTVSERSRIGQPILWRRWVNYDQTER